MSRCPHPWECPAPRIELGRSFKSGSISSEKCIDRPLQHCDFTSLHSPRQQSNHYNQSHLYFLSAQQHNTSMPWLKIKFSTVFSIFLAALSVGVSASPIPLDQPDAIAVPDGVVSQPFYDEELDNWGAKHGKAPITSQQKGSAEVPTTETDAYKAVAKVGKNLQLNKYYAFHITNTLKSPPVKEEATSYQWGMKAAWLPAHLLRRR